MPLANVSLFRGKGLSPQGGADELHELHRDTFTTSLYVPMYTYAYGVVGI